jgi:hypothetical protein
MLVLCNASECQEETLKHVSHVVVPLSVLSQSVTNEIRTKMNGIEEKSGLLISNLSGLDLAKKELQQVLFSFLFRNVFLLTHLSHFRSVVSRNRPRSH